MKKLLILTGLAMALSACSSAPEPETWKGLNNLPIEPINDRAKIAEIYKEMDNKSVWKSR